MPFEFGPDQGPLTATRGKKGPSSTITESEKRVFDEIFGSISQRQKQLGVPLVPDLEPQPQALGWEPEEGLEDQELNRERRSRWASRRRRRTGRTLPTGTSPPRPRPRTRRR